MKLIKHDAFFNDPWTDLDRLFEATLPELYQWNPIRFGNRTKSLPLDVYEDDNVRVIRLEIPGVSKKDIHIELENAVLSVNAKRIEKTDDGFTVRTNTLSLSAPNILVATGGVSYPKTGSTGDGQQWAEKLGHSLYPLQAGLVGFEVQSCSLSRDVGARHPQVTVEIFSNNKSQFKSEGLLEVERWGLGGGAITNASRIITRSNLKNVHFEIDLGTGSKPVKVKPTKIRSIKEAMVTVGGVSLSEIDPQTMQSKKCDGLYFAGEVMDVDGPTGGYNLTAAFASARLAVKTIADA